MQAPFRILTYLVVVYGLLFSCVFAIGKSVISPDFQIPEPSFSMESSVPDVVESGSIPEPASIGFVAFLVVLLALQRHRGE